MTLTNEQVAALQEVMNGKTVVLALQNNNNNITVSHVLSYATTEFGFAVFFHYGPTNEILPAFISGNTLQLQG